MKVKPFIIVVYTLVFLLFSAFILPHPGPKTNDKFVVVLDAGHGGHDPGNLGNGFLEKEIALGIVLEAGKALENDPDIQVVYTRKDDRFVDLYVRGEIANKAKADLFVSIHCDSHSSDANGAGTFVLGLHANKQNFEIAKKENSVIYLEDNYESRYAAYDINSPESIIGLTIMQEEFLDQSILLGKMMQDNFTKKLSRKDRKVKQAGFIVLHQTFMPSVLIETGFLTNKSEGNYLNSRKGQAEMGKAIADAIVLYKSNLWSQTTGFEDVGENVVTSAPVVQQAAEEIPPPEITDEAEEISAIATSPEPGNTEISKQENKNEPSTTKEDMAAAEVLNKDEKQAVAVEKELGTKQMPEELQTEVPEIKQTESNEIVESKPPAKDPMVIPAETGDVDSKKTVKEDTPEVSIEEKKEEKAVAEKKSQPEIKRTESPATAVKKEEIIFKVQILASSKEIPLQANNFKGLSTISKEPYKNLFRYMYGKTPSYKQAKLLKSNADLKGYSTSFIVAYRNGVRIPVNEAVKYSSE